MTLQSFYLRRRYATADTFQILRSKIDIHSRERGNPIMADKTYDRPTFASDFIKSDSDRAVFFDNPAMDNMMTTVIALGAEVWTVRRRMKVLEALLEDKGIDEEMIESYMPSKDRIADWQEDRDAFVKRTFSALANEGDLDFSGEPLNKDS